MRETRKVLVKETENCSSRRSVLLQCGFRLPNAHYLTPLMLLYVCLGLLKGITSQENQTPSVL